MKQKKKVVVIGNEIYTPMKPKGLTRKQLRERNRLIKKYTKKGK